MEWKDRRNKQEKDSNGFLDAFVQKSQEKMQSGKEPWGKWNILFSCPQSKLYAYIGVWEEDEEVEDSQKDLSIHL